MKSFLLIIILIFSQSTNAEKRPRVLIIGDSIYNEVARSVASVLKGRADISYVKYGSYDSSTALVNFKKLLEGKKWDLIHFNFGFNDLMHKNPSTKAVRAMHKDVGGVQVSSPELYEKNLRELVKRFRDSGAKVIWASTTPIIGSNGILFEGDEIKYNEIAAGVMKESNVRVNDMYSFGKASHKKVRNPKTFNYKGGIPLHPPIVEAIVSELNLRKEIKGPVKAFIMIGDNKVYGQGLISDTRKARSGRAGSLDNLVLGKTTGLDYKHLINTDKSWSSRNDVWVKWYSRSSGNLSIGYGERNNMFGPELGFGHNMGDHLDQQVLLFKPYLKSNLTNKSFFANKNGVYSELLNQIQTSISNLHYSFPDYTKQSKTKISGIIIHYNNGEKDIKTYAKNLKLLINNLRRDLKNNKLPILISGAVSDDKSEDLIKIQRSVSSDLPNVNFIDTRNIWSGQSSSSKNSSGHAAGFYKFGYALAEEMKKLL